VDGYRVGITVTSRLTREGMETLEILDKPYTLLRVDEDIEAEALGFRARNRYWVDPLTASLCKANSTSARASR